jgi:hypothetical protein
LNVPLVVREIIDQIETVQTVCNSHKSSRLTNFVFSPVYRFFVVVVVVVVIMMMILFFERENSI